MLGLQLIKIHHNIGKYRMKPEKLRLQYGNYWGTS